MSVLDRFRNERDAELRVRAAHALGMPTRELMSVTETGDGTVVTTMDGQRLIIVPDDRPDAAGNTGLMMLEAPRGKNAHALPVFTPQGVDSTPEALVDSAPPAEPEDIADVHQLDRRLGEIAAEMDELLEARESTASMDALAVLDERVRHLEAESTVLRARRPMVRNTEAVSRDAAARRFEHERVDRAADIVLAAADVIDPIRSALAELRRLHEEAVVASAPAHWLATLGTARDLAARVGGQWETAIAEAADVKAGRDPRTFGGVGW